MKTENGLAWCECAISNGTDRCISREARHTAYTTAGASKEKDARSYFAGHAWSGLAEIYNEDFDDQRLVIIGELIDKWLDSDC